MNMHKNARLMPQGRLLLVQRITKHRWTVGAAARECQLGALDRVVGHLGRLASR
jgi:hypothetical protein